MCVPTMFNDAPRWLLLPPPFDKWPRRSLTCWRAPNMNSRSQAHGASSPASLFVVVGRSVDCHRRRWAAGGPGPLCVRRRSSSSGLVGRPWSWVVNHWSSVFGPPSSVVGRRSWVAGSKPSKGRTVCACRNAAITDPMPWRIPTEAGTFDATVHVRGSVC